MRNGLGNRAEADRLEKPTLPPRTARHADIQAFGLCRRQVRYQCLDVAVEAKRASNIVGGPDRQDCQGNVAVAKPTGDPRHGAVAAGDDHQVPSLAQGLLVVVLARLIFGPKTSDFQLAHQLVGIGMRGAGGRIVKQQCPHVRSS